SRSSSTISAKISKGVRKTQDNTSDEDQPELNDSEGCNGNLNDDGKIDEDNDAGSQDESCESGAISIEADESSPNDDDDSASAILSTEAERILENAKKR